MKKVVIALALSLVAVGLLGVPAMAAAVKLDLAPAPSTTGLTGSGFVVFNNSSGSKNMELTVSLKSAPANTTYEVWLENNGQPMPGSPVGKFTTNKAGNGNFHINMKMAPGTYNLGIDIAIGGGDQFVTSNVYGPAILITFK